MYCSQMQGHQTPDTNALSLPGGTYWLLPPTNTCAASYEYLCYLLRVPATDLSLVDFAVCLKKHLRYCVMDCFTTAKSLPAAILYLSMITSQAMVQRLAVAEFVFHIPRNNFLQKALCTKDRGHLNDTFENRFEVH